PCTHFPFASAHARNCGASIRKAIPLVIGKCLDAPIGVEQVFDAKCLFKPLARLSSTSSPSSSTLTMF
ncbi:MAG: hypothetical protein WBO57_10770, partial [Gammaproteobacteria bacterium]